MKDWVFSVASIVLISAIVSLILPEGRMGKYIKGMFSLVIMLVILQPVIDFDFSKVDFDMTTNKTIPVQDEYLDYIAGEKTGKLEDYCNLLIEECGVKNAEVDIMYSYTYGEDIKIEKVVINLENSVIISDKEHIYIIEEIKNEVSEYLGIKKDLVDVNE